MTSFGVSDFQAIFHRFSERPCLLAASGEILTYGAVETAALRVAAGLKTAGLTPGDVVTLLADNSVEHAVALLGAWTAGLVTASVNAELGAEQIAAIARNAKAFAVLCDAKHRSQAEAGECPALDFGELRSAPAAEGERIFGSVRPDQPLVIVYTAGSTGLPKGVQLSGAALLSNERMFCEAMGVNERNRFFNILPMSYLGGVHNLMLLPMTAGASVVIDRPLGASNLFYFWRRVRDLGVDTLWLTGAMLSLLLQIPPRGDETWIGEQVKLGLVGMAPLNRETRLRFEARFGFRLHQNYALSETLFLTSQRPGSISDPTGCGPVLPDVEIALRAPDGQVVGDGEEGELFVRTPHMMLGYRDAPASDQAALQEGVFRTGDLGRFDDHGELIVTGRIKDLIIRGGLNISPALVEAALLRSPLVEEAAVVGAPDSTYGEEVTAFLRLSPEGLRLPEKDARTQIADDVRPLLAAFQRPKQLIFLEALPRNHARKIDKPALRRRLASAPAEPLA